MTDHNNEYRTLAEHNVGEGDVVQHQRDATKWKIKQSDEGLALWQESSKFWGVTLDESEQLYRVISRAPKPEQREQYFVTQDGQTFGDYDMALHHQGGSGPIERVEVVEVIQPWPQPVPDVPWDALADWVQYVAMDENGGVWGYCSAPAKDEFQWSGSEVADFCDVRAVKIDWKGLPWDQTLTKRLEEF
jgi:hypothetical protein